MNIGVSTIKQSHLKCLNGINTTLGNGMMTQRLDLYAFKIQNRQLGRALIIK